MINASDPSTRSLLSMPVSSILNPNIPILDHFQTAADAITTMKERSVRSVLISSRKKEIIGVVSKTDILYRVVSLHKSPVKVVLEEIMSSPIISIPPNMSIADAFSVMEKHDIRQVVVSFDSKIYGMVDREDTIIRMEKALIETANAFKIDSPLCILDPMASTHIANKRSMLACPHCQTEYKDKELLSKHVKVIHSVSR
jgi:CBS domain-containing protein